MDTRRDLLKKFGLAAAVTATGVGATRAARDASLRAFASGGTTSDAPWWLVAPLGAGASLGRGWSLGQLSPVEDGAAVLALRHRDGREACVHLCTHRGRPVGVASTALFDLVLMDGRDGAGRTDEGLARVLVSLSRRIRRNELRDQPALAGLERLLTHEERVAIYGPENLA